MIVPTEAIEPMEAIVPMEAIEAIEPTMKTVYKNSL